MAESKVVSKSPETEAWAITEPRVSPVSIVEWSVIEREVATEFVNVALGREPTVVTV